MLVYPVIFKRVGVYKQRTISNTLFFIKRMVFTTDAFLQQIIFAMIFTANCLQGILQQIFGQRKTAIANRFYRGFCFNKICHNGWILVPEG
jgi:hypothetical protein